MAELFESYGIWITWTILGLFFLVMLVMAPCHAVFLLPFAGLPLFWLLPLGYALPINMAAWLTTPFLFRVVRRAMMKPVQGGFQSLVGATAEVVSRLQTGRSAKYLVRVKGAGELWSAYSTDVLEVGESVNIVAWRGVGLVVQRAEDRHSGQDDSAGKTLPGKNDRKPHCH